MVTPSAAGNHSRKVYANWFNDFLSIIHQANKYLGEYRILGLQVGRLVALLFFTDVVLFMFVVLFFPNVEAIRHSQLPIYLIIN